MRRLRNEEQLKQQKMKGKKKERREFDKMREENELVREKKLTQVMSIYRIYQ
jgi:hypothetical protein